MPRGGGGTTCHMRRRHFLKLSASLLTTGAGACAPGSSVDWANVRIRRPASDAILRAVAADASELLARATGSAVPLVDSAPEGSRPGVFEIILSVTQEALEGGGYSIRVEPGALRIEAATSEGVRNGLYAFLEHQGFHFFRDGESIPSLRGPLRLEAESETVDAPRFELRGDMIWNNYLGPGRSCASMWGRPEWERALTFMARNRMNFLEFYPPLEHLLTLSFPELEALGKLEELDRGRVVSAREELHLARDVLARGRELGIRFMYVLTYGAFPEPISKAFPGLEWRNGFLCAHQSELAEMTSRVWKHLIDELGTDHLYAIRHRGEEEQVYSDPCRSVTKADGFRQAFEVARDVDPEAVLSVWTWGERLPDLFEAFHGEVVAAHVRHGMADVFGDRGSGREQRRAAPDIAPERPWLSTQFTVFSAWEASVQTAWSDAPTLARDALEASRSPANRGYFQWPEWTDTSPWLSHVIARLSWDPEAVASWGDELALYAEARHGVEAAPSFARALSPILELGNARFMKPPWKRLIVPYALSETELVAIAAVREGLADMASRLDGEGPMYHRDFVDIALWLGTRQVQAFEADAYLAHLRGEDDRAAEAIRSAVTGWDAVQSILSEVPELGLFETARAIQAKRELAIDFVDRFWELGFAFYNGYPLVVSPESISLVYRRQTLALEQAIADAVAASQRLRLADPGWFWHDFPASSWGDGVRALPDLSASAIEVEFKERLHASLAREPRNEPSGVGGPADYASGLGPPSIPSTIDPGFVRLALRGLLDPKLPAPLPQAPDDIPLP